MFQSNQKTVPSIFEFSFNKTFNSNTSFIQKLCDKILSLFWVLRTSCERDNWIQKLTKNLWEKMSIEIVVDKIGLPGYHVYQKNLEAIHWPDDKICTRRKKFLW